MLRGEAEEGDPRSVVGGVTFTTAPSVEGVLMGVGGVWACKAAPESKKLRQGVLRAPRDHSWAGPLQGPSWVQAWPLQGLPDP